MFIPDRVLLAWPQFAIDGDWCGVEEIYGVLEPRTAGALPFANDGETLVEAVRSTAVDFEGKDSDLLDGLRPVAFRDGARRNLRRARRSVRSARLIRDTWKGKAFELLYAGRRSA